MALFCRTWRHSGPPSATARSVLLLALLLGAESPAQAACGVEFLYPQGGEKFHFNDVLNVTYVSHITAPTLYCWCGGPGAASQKATVPNAPPLNGSVLLELDFTSFEPCWLNLRPNSEECEGSGDNSLPFSIDNTRGSLATLGLPQPSATKTGGRASAPSDPKQGHNGLSTGASVAIGVGATVVVLALIGGIFALVWLQRKKRNQEKVRQSYNHAGGLWRRSEKPQPLLALEPRSLTHSSRSSLQQLHGLPTSFVAPGMTFSTTPDSATHIMSGARQSRVGHNAVVAPQDEHRQLIPAMHEGAPLSASMYQPTPVGFYASRKEPSRNHIRDREVSNEPVEYPGRDASMDLTTSAVMHPYEPTELPGKESHRGYGEEYELSIPQHPRPFQPSGHEVQEQKFLLDDVELREMKQQARLKQGR